MYTISKEILLSDLKNAKKCFIKRKLNEDERLKIIDKLEEEIFLYRKRFRGLSIEDFKYCSYRDLERFSSSQYLSEKLRKQIIKLKKTKRLEYFIGDLKYSAKYYPELNEILDLKNVSIMYLDMDLKELYKKSKSNKYIITKEMINDLFKYVKSEYIPVYSHKLLDFLIKNQIIGKKQKIYNEGYYFKDIVSCQLTENEIQKHKEVWKLNERMQTGLISQTEKNRLKKLKSKNFGRIKLYNEENFDFRLIESLENFNECYKEQIYYFIKKPNLSIDNKNLKKEVENISINDLKKLSYEELCAKFEKIVFLITDDLKKEILELLKKKKKLKYKRLKKAHYFPQLNEISFLCDSEIYFLDKCLFKMFEKHEKLSDILSGIFGGDLFISELKKMICDDVFCKFSKFFNEIIIFLMDKKIIDARYTFSMCDEDDDDDFEIWGLMPISYIFNEDLIKNQEVWYLQDRIKQGLATEYEKKLLKLLKTATLNKFSQNECGIIEVLDEDEDGEDIKEKITSQEEFDNHYKHTNFFFITKPRLYFD